MALPTPGAERHWKCRCSVWVRPSESAVCPCCKSTVLPQKARAFQNAAALAVECPHCRRAGPNEPECIYCGGKLRKRTDSEAQAARQAEIDRHYAKLASGTGSPVCLALLAELYNKSHDYPRSLFYAEWLTQIEPKNYCGWLYAVQALAQMGRKKEANDTAKRFRAVRGWDRTDREIISGWIAGLD
ncbi:MAG: hypothetical protein ACO1SX_00210 [Actinomycetota bacterium]